MKLVGCLRRGEWQGLLSVSWERSETVQGAHWPGVTAKLVNLYGQFCSGVLAPS